MSDGTADDDGAWRTGRGNLETHDQGPRPSVAAPKPTTLVQGVPPPAPSKALELALTSIEQNTAKLSSAIAALDHHRAWATTIDLKRTIAYAQRLLDAQAGSPEHAQRLRALKAAADLQIARAPAPSEAALREITSPDPKAPRPHWEAEQRAWLASHGGRAGAAPASSSPRGRDPTVAVGPTTANAPPDLGNYDSATGKHVQVLRTWDDTTIAARRVELQGRLSWTTDIEARDELLREYEAIEWVAHERHLALPKDPGEEAAPQAFVGGKLTKSWLPATSQGMRAMLEREMAAGTGYEAARAHAQRRLDHDSPMSRPRSRSATEHDQWQIVDRGVACHHRSRRRAPAAAIACSLIAVKSISPGVWTLLAVPTGSDLAKP